MRGPIGPQGDGEEESAGRGDLTASTPLSYRPATVMPSIRVVGALVP